MVFPDVVTDSFSVLSLKFTPTLELPIGSGVKIHTEYSSGR